MGTEHSGLLQAAQPVNCVQDRMHEFRRIFRMAKEKPELKHKLITPAVIKELNAFDESMRVVLAPYLQSERQACTGWQASSAASLNPKLLSIDGMITSVSHLESRLILNWKLKNSEFFSCSFWHPDASSAL